MPVILLGSAIARSSFNPCPAQVCIRAAPASPRVCFIWPPALCLCNSLCLEGLSTSYFLRLMAILRPL